MQQARILIADDDAMLRLDLRTMLEDLGHSVIAETDGGLQACELARTQRPDLAILDVMMPRGNGLDAAETFAKERLGPVLLLTAYSDVPVIERATRAGVLGYLVKPFRQRELQPAVEIAISRYREMAALESALANVQESAETAKVVGKARRVLSEKHGLTDQEAYRRLQARAISTGKPIREVADAILLTEEMAPGRPGPR